MQVSPKTMQKYGNLCTYRQKLLTSSILKVK